MTKADRSKRALLHAARELVEEFGYDSVGIRDICAKASLSIGAFYHHFENKDALLNEAFELFDETLSEKRWKQLDQVDSLQALWQLLLDQCRFTKELGPKVMGEYYRALLAQRGDMAVNPMRDYYQAVLHYVEVSQREGLLRSQEEARILAERLIRIVRGNLLDWSLHHGSYDVEEVTKEDLRILLGSISRLEFLEE